MDGALELQRLQALFRTRMKVPHAQVRVHVVEVAVDTDITNSGNTGAPPLTQTFRIPT